MLGKDAVSMEMLMKQPITALMQLSAERFDCIYKLAKEVQKSRAELEKVSAELAKASTSKPAAASSVVGTASRVVSAAGSGSSSWLGSDASDVPTVLPFPSAGLLVDKPDAAGAAFSDAIHSRQFYDWCLASLTNENLEFYHSVELYRTLPPAARAVKAAEILRHFVREGSTAQINIDHAVRSSLEAALPPPLIALVDKMTADAAAEAARNAARASESISVLDFLAEEPPKKTTGADKLSDSSKKKRKDAPAAVAPPPSLVVTDPLLQNIPATLFDDAQARVFELMERDAWVRFSVEQQQKKSAKKTASQPLVMKSGKKAADTKDKDPAAAVAESPPTSPRSAKQKAPALISQIKRDRTTGKIVVIRRGE